MSRRGKAPSSFTHEVKTFWKIGRERVTCGGCLVSSAVAAPPHALCHLGTEVAMVVPHELRKITAESDRRTNTQEPPRGGRGL